MMSVQKAALIAIPSLALAITAATPAQAQSEMRGTITHVGDLPPNTPFGTMDLGWKYDSFTVMGMPLWGSGEGTFVVYEKSSGEEWRFKELSTDQARTISALYEIDLVTPTALERFWGSLVILGSILFWSFIINRILRHRRVSGALRPILKKRPLDGAA